MAPNNLETLNLLNQPVGGINLLEIPISETLEYSMG